MRLKGVESRPTSVEHHESIVESREPAVESRPERTARVPVDVRSAALTILALLAVIMVLKTAQAMIIPIVLGVLISYALDPPVTWLTRLRVPRALAAALLLAAVVVGGCSLLYALRFEAAAIVDNLPQAARRVRQALEHGRPATPTAIDRVQKAATELEKAADAAATPPPAPSGVTRVQVEAAPFNVTDYLVWGSIGVVAAIGQLVLVLFLVFFLLSSGDMYRRKLVKIVGPSFANKKITVQILEDIDRQIEWFLLVELFTSVIVGVGTWLAFRAVGMEQAAVWGLLAGIFNSIPYFGPVVVTAGIAAVAFLQFGTVQMAAIVAGISLVITSLEGYLLTPWLTSRGSRMNAVAIFIGLLFWGWVWNIWGMLLAVPMMMVLKAVCDHIEDFKGIGELLGD
jgi:predicted PurR-regulated permease PerM